MAATNLKVITSLAMGEIEDARHSCPIGRITARWLTAVGTSDSSKALKCKDNSCW
jgi:hypothetical protein